MDEDHTGKIEPVRCAWPGLATDALYKAYHDTEWGVPVHDDRRLLEKLILEGFQSGLSWLTILKKRENFRRAFHGFEPEHVARFSDTDIARLLDDPGIIRSRAKIEAAIGNARAYLDLAAADPGVEQPLAAMLWTFAPKRADPPGSPAAARHAHGDVPAVTAESTAMAKALKSHGFRFVGPTTAYAFMQSVGMVNDHLATCHRHGTCEKLQRGVRA